jgi:hypothetical protein
MSIHALLCYVRDLSRECGAICAISRFIPLSILHVFLWSLTSTYICIYATLTLIVCRCFVFSTARVVFVFFSLVLLFLCCLGHQVLLARLLTAIVSTCGVMLRIIGLYVVLWICVDALCVYYLTICYVARWFLLLAAPVLHFVILFCCVFFHYSVASLHIGFYAMYVFLNLYCCFLWCVSILTVLFVVTSLCFCVGYACSTIMWNRRKLNDVKLGCNDTNRRRQSHSETHLSHSFLIHHKSHDGLGSSLSLRHEWLETKRLIPDRAVWRHCWHCKAVNSI